ncbi:CYCU4-1, partial [Symbiodinium pilosum]
IAKYFQCSRECFVLCLVYIDRIVKLHPDFTICSLNIHRLLVTSVMLSVKFFDDVYYSNAYYAKVGGVKTREVNILEGQFLQLIEWKLHVTPE